MGYPIYFRLEATFFYKSFRASMTKHRQQSTKVRARFNMESVLFFSVTVSLDNQPPVQTALSSSGPEALVHLLSPALSVTAGQRWALASPPAGFDFSFIQQFNKRCSRHCYKCRRDRCKRLTTNKKTNESCSLLAEQNCSGKKNKVGKEAGDRWWAWSCWFSWWSGRCHCVCSVAQSCLTLCDHVDYSTPGSSVHGILQAWILEWVAIPFSRGSSWPRDRTHVSCIAGRFFTTELPGKPTEEVTFEQRSEGGERVSHGGICGNNSILGRWPVSAEALKCRSIQCVWGTERRPVWQQRNEWRGA